MHSPMRRRWCTFRHYTYNSSTHYRVQRLSRSQVKHPCFYGYNPQVLTLDIGFGDVVTPEAIELDYPVLLEHLPFANILAYSIETVIAEKMHAIIDLADQSSRMKDYYDLYQILTTKQYDVEILKEAVQRTFENRHTKYKDDTAFFRTEYPNSLEMQVRWKAFIRKIASDTDLSFTDVAYYLQIQLKPYWNNLRHKG